MIKLEPYREKPGGILSAIIHAIQFDGTEDMALKLMECISQIRPLYVEGLFQGIVIETLTGKKRIAKEGDWIICGTLREFYPCKNDIFVKKYERVIEEAG